MKTWSGTSWSEKPAKVWNGGAWTGKPVKVWDGFQWVVKGGLPVTAGLTIQLDATQMGLSDGAYVNSWPSLVGSLTGTNISTAPYRPVMRFNALNTKPVVRFIIGSGLRWSGTGIDLNWTVIYVGRMWGTSAGRIVTSTYTPSNLLIGYWNGFENVAYVEGFLTPDARRSQTTQWRLVTGTGEGVPGDARAWLYENGIYQSGGQPASQNGGGWKGYFNLNGYAATSTEETCDSEIAELLFYNRRLTDPERVSVEGYMRTKWGLP
jgi:hypothetical protein